MGTLLMTLDDGTIPGNTEEEKQNLLKYWYSFNLDRYYDQIREVTFETFFIDFSREEVEAWLKSGSNKGLNDEQKNHLANLKTRLEEAISKFVKQGKRAFVKLSTRSPKDAVDKLSARIVPIIKEEIDRMGEKTQNNIHIAVRKAFMKCMSVASADEALQLFSASARIIGDLTRALNYTGEWSIHIVVREFIDIPLEGELRGIVHKKKLNALSQYYTSCYFPNLVKHKDDVAKHVIEFHEQIKDKIEAESYIVDFAVIDEKTIKIVELNPFGEAAGSALFNWNTDKNIIENGPFEFRVEESADEAKIKTMLTIWRGLIDAALGQSGNEDYNNINKGHNEDDGHGKKGDDGHSDKKKKDCIVM